VILHNAIARPLPMVQPLTLSLLLLALFTRKAIARVLKFRVENPSQVI
jgi:hypothetical protein